MVNITLKFHTGEKWIVLMQKDNNWIWLLQYDIHYCERQYYEQSS